MNTPILVKSLALTAMIIVSTAHAADSNPPGKMTFQGFLTDASTPPVPLGNTSPVNKEVIFRIYDAATGGTVKWGEKQIVTVDKGYFSVLLGEGSDVDGGTPRPELYTVFSGIDASDRWLAITVDDTEVTPRSRYFSTPYTHLARTANSLTPNATINVQSGATIAGNITSSGDLTVGGITSSGDLTVGGITSSGNINTTGELRVGGKVGIGIENPRAPLEVTRNDPDAP
ncbi:MAG TPA: hypothetical protein EYQ31_03800, partial [Candidatus Handelsmanbacteria bacterium]|nr:hypothetical protein [Candidatus Handelsmanbacteria bacterium]